MTKRTQRCLNVLLVGLLAVPPAAHAVTLTLAEATRLALERDRGIRAAEAGEKKARAELQQAFLGMFPRIGFSAGYTRLDQVPYVEFDMSEMTGTSSTDDPCLDIDPDTLPPGWTVEMAQSMCYMILGWMTVDTSESTVTRIDMGVLDNYFVTGTVEQVLFAGGALYQGYQASKDFHRASRHQLRSARQNAAFNTAQGYYQLILARDAARVSEEALDTVSAYVKDLENLVEAGVASRADLMAAQAKESKSRLEAIRARHGADLAELAFKVALGIPRDEPLELEMDERWEVDLADTRDDLVAQARSRRPDLAMLDANLSAMRHLTKATWASWLPSLVIMGNLNWRNPNYSLEPVWYRSADLTVAASWNVWDRGVALEKSRATRAAMLQLQHQRDLAAEMMDVELESALASFDEAVKEIEVARVGLAQAEEAYRLEHERFKYGMVNNVQLLSAQSALAGAKLSLLQAEAQMRISYAALRKAAGLDPEVSQ